MQGWTEIQDFRYSNYNGTEQALSSDFINKLRVTLKKCGWERDGVLEAMMGPPFFATRAIAIGSLSFT